MTTAPLPFARPSGRPPLRIVPTPGKLSITPASRVCFDVIDQHADLLRGRGIDWGTGSGVLAVAAATASGVELVVGLDTDAADLATARTNAELNGVADRTIFIRTDLFTPFPGEDATALHALEGSADFLIANPPASVGDDGLGFRRRVLSGALTFLRPGAVALVQISRQYGRERAASLAGSDYVHHGVIGSSDWVPFDLGRDDLRDALHDYAAEERRSGVIYPFLHPVEDTEIDATAALALWESDGLSPRSQWQVHRFERLPARPSDVIA